MKRIIYTENAPAPIGPYNQAIITDNTLYVSGQIAIDPRNGELRIEDLEEETHLVLKNMGAILEAAGMDYSNVVKCSLFISDMNNFSRINTVYAQYFTEDAPARETVEVACLPKNVNVEISCIAAF